MAYLYFAIICLLFGSNFMLMDQASLAFGPATVGAGRLGSGAVVLLLALLATKQSLRIDRKTLAHVFLVAGLSNAYPFAVQPWLLQQGCDHSFLAMFVPFTPLLTIFASVPLLGIRPTWQQLAGVAGGLVLLLWIAGDSAQHGLHWMLMPVVLSVPLSYALGNTYLRRHLTHVPAVVLSTYMLGIACLLLVPFASYEILTHPPQTNSQHWTSALQALVTLGILGTGACIGLFVWLVQQRGPLFAGMVTYVVPIIALVWGYLDHEKISAGQLFAILGILAMVALVQSSQTTLQSTSSPTSQKEPVKNTSLATATPSSDE